MCSLKILRLDLHIHSTLSPCTELGEMTPRAIVRAAIEKGLDMIAICDHNSSRNSGAAIMAAQESPLSVIPGIEITSSEETHVLGLFPTLKKARAAQEEAYSRLPGTNDEKAIGYQVVVDECDMVEDLEQALLIGATTMNIHRVVELIHSLDGLAVASHVDRPGFGIFSQLGFIPDDLELDALEISKHINFDDARKKYRQLANYTLVTSSDAHYVSDIGAAYTEAEMAEASFDELILAIRGDEGRRIIKPSRLV
jgi:3',5'-nucleoside bisphosphate phosphatase